MSNIDKLKAKGIYKKWMIIGSIRLDNIENNIKCIITYGYIH